MARMCRLLPGAVMAAALALAGCAEPFSGPEDSYDARTAHPITVAPRMATLRVPYSGAGAGLSAEMNARLADFAKGYLALGSGAISVSAPESAADAPDYFAARLVELGVPKSHILVGTSGALAPGDMVEISYIRYSAEVAPCGDWSENLADTASNTAPPDFGCASQHNLAAMVADPRDIVAPQPEMPADAKRRMTVLDKYRKGEPTPAVVTPAQSGSVSDLGKQ